MDVAQTLMEEEDSEDYRPTDRQLLLSLRLHMRYIRKDIADLKEKFDLTARKEEVEDHEKRLRVLENFRWWILGGAGAAAFLGNVIANLLKR